MFRSYKFLLQPTARQRRSLELLLAAQREIYNAALEERRAAWKMARHSVSRFDQFAQLSFLGASRPDVMDFGTVAARGTLTRLDRAFQGFYRRCRQGAKAGFPRFKGAARFDTVSYEDASSGWKLKENDRRLYLQGIGHVKVRLHRNLRGTPKSCHVRREGRRWWVIVQCSDVPATPLPATGRAAGIDVGVANLAASSDGELFANPRHTATSAAELAAAQQALARKQRGSNRRRRAAARVAAVHRRIANRRRDTHHQLSRRLVNTYDTLVFEDLAIANMVRSARGSLAAPGHNVAAKAGLNREIHSAGWAQLLAMVAYKAEEAGRDLILVAAHNTSRRCPHCGHTTVANRPHQAVFRCQACGHAAHADVNAAINILRAGQAQRPQREVETHAT